MPNDQESSNNKSVSPMVNFLGVTIYYPSLRNGLVIIFLLVVVFAFILLFSHLRREFKEETDAFIQDIQNVIHIVGLTFGDETENKEKLSLLSKKIAKTNEKKDYRIQISFWTHDANTWGSIRTHTEENEWQEAVTNETVIGFMK